MFPEMMGEEWPGGMEIFQARLLVEMFMGGVELSATPEPFGPRKRDQEESAARAVPKRERDARRAAEMSLIRGNTSREITDFGREGEGEMDF